MLSKVRFIIFAVFISNQASAAISEKFPKGSILEAVQLEIPATPYYRNRQLPKLDIISEIDENLRTNPDALIAKEFLKQEETRSDIQWSRLFPVFTGTAGIEHADNPLGFPKSGKADTHSFTLSTSYPLFEGFQWLNRYRQTQEQVAASLNSVQSVSNVVGLRIAARFIALLRERCNYEHAVANYLYMKKVREKVETFKGDASLKEQYLAQAQARESTFHAVKKDSYNTQFVAMYDYMNDTDKNLDGYWLVEPEAIEVPKSEDESIRLAIQINPNILQAMNDYEAKIFGVAAAKGAFYPKLLAYGQIHNGQRDSDTFGDYERKGGIVGGQIVLDLDYYKNYSNLQIAKSDAEIASLRKVKTTRSTLVAIRKTHMQLNQVGSALGDATDAVSNSIKAVAAQEKRIFDSPNSVKTLLDEREKLFAAEVNLNKLDYQFRLLTYQLHSEIGDLPQKLNVESSTLY